MEALPIQLQQMLPGSPLKNLGATTLGAPNWIAPGADMEKHYSPQSYDICDAIFSDFFSESV